MTPVGSSVTPGAEYPRLSPYAGGGQADNFSTAHFRLSEGARIPPNNPAPRFRSAAKIVTPKAEKGEWQARTRMEDPNTKIQRSSKSQDPNSYEIPKFKTQMGAVAGFRYLLWVVPWVAEFGQSRFE